MFAQFSDPFMAALFAGIGGLLVAGVPAWVALQRAWQDIAERKAAAAKLERNGVLEEWRGVTDALNQRVVTQNGRIDGLEKEITELHTQVTALYAENSQLRGLLAMKDTRVEKQATQVEKLQTAVTLMKDAVPAVNLPAGTEVKIPESTLKENQ